MEKFKININDITDYIIIKTAPLSVLKLHKLLYYVQSWYLVFYEEPLFHEQFQAWVHGPICRDIFDRFKATKILYSVIEKTDILPSFNPNLIPEDIRTHIDEILDSYAKFSGSQLENLVRNEKPWMEARKGFLPAERCEQKIDESIMKSWYSERRVDS